MAWFLVPQPRPGAVARLFCLPYAGGSAALYRDWGRLLPGTIELQSVQLAGRGWRLKEAPCRDLEATADEVAAAIEPRADLPFALFGHSMGAWLAFLVARALTARGCSPRLLLVSGLQAPSVGMMTPPLGHLDDDAFVTEVRALYGSAIPGEVLADPQLLALLLPALRADLDAVERYVHRPGRLLECPVVAFGGSEDPVVPVEYLASWAAETTGAFRIEVQPGDHFYFMADPRPLLGSIAVHVEATSRGAAASARTDRPGLAAGGGR